MKACLRAYIYYDGRYGYEYDDCEWNLTGEFEREGYTHDPRESYFPHIVSDHSFRFPESGVDVYIISSTGVNDPGEIFVGNFGEEYNHEGMRRRCYDDIMYEDGVKCDHLHRSYKANTNLYAVLVEVFAEEYLRYENIYYMRLE